MCDGVIMPPNKYGYRVNIVHPAVAPLYERFRRWKGIPRNFPLSDAERLEFESYILEKVEKKNADQQDLQHGLYGSHAENPG